MPRELVTFPEPEFRSVHFADDHGFRPGMRVIYNSQESLGLYTYGHVYTVSSVRGPFVYTEESGTEFGTYYWRFAYWVDEVPRGSKPKKHEGCSFVTINPLA